MRKITDVSYKVKYPAREKATAFMPEDQRPFRHAVVGVTFPFPDYNIVSGSKKTYVNNLEYVVDGEGEIFLNGRWERASAGDIFILRERESHDYRANPDAPWHKIWINYVADYISPFFEAYGVSSGIYHIPEMRRYFDRALELSRNADVSVDTCYEIADCVHSIITHISAHASHRTQSDAYRIRELLNASTYKKLDLDGASAELHISKSNIIRLFKKHYGVTPYDYLLELKMESAKLLLTGTGMPVKEIAAKLCICDEHYFSSLFLRRTGMRPRDYRENYRQ